MSVRIPSRHATLATAVCVMASIAGGPGKGDAAAQTIRGRVLDEATGTSVPWVYVPVFERPCGTVFLDGIRIPPDDLAALEAESLHAVLIVPPEVRLMTVGFEQQFRQREGGG